MVKCQMGGCRSEENENSPDSCKNGQVQILVSAAVPVWAPAELGRAAHPGRGRVPLANPAAPRADRDAFISPSLFLSFSPLSLALSPLSVFL